jgi:hypothetical protein
LRQAHVSRAGKVLISAAAVARRATFRLKIAYLVSIRRVFV